MFSRDIQIGGYNIPAGITVQMNLSAVLRSGEYWTDPDNFLPERFINEENKIVIPEQLNRE